MNSTSIKVIAAAAFLATGCGSTPDGSANSEHVVVNTSTTDAVIDLRQPDRTYEISSKLDASQVTVISPNGASSSLHDWLATNGVDTSRASDATVHSPPVAATTSDCAPVCVQVCTGQPPVCGVICYYNCSGGGGGRQQ